MVLLLVIIPAFLNHGWILVVARLSQEQLRQLRMMPGPHAAAWLALRGPVRALLSPSVCGLLTFSRWEELLHAKTGDLLS